jgi:hypothetical protein
MLDIQRQTWVNDDVIEETHEPVYSYVKQLKDRLKIAQTAARQFADTEQRAWKTQHDRHAKPRSFTPNDLVLILRPTSPNKLLAKLDGPFPVVRKVDQFNYIVNLGHRNAAFNINSLRLYKQRQQDIAVNIVLTRDDSDECIDDDEFDYRQAIDTPAGSIKMGAGLTQSQREDVNKLVSDFPEVFSDQLGLTHLVHHQIRLTDDTPTSRPAYKVPYSIADQLDEELTQMLTDDVIEPSDSPWSTGIVPIIKADYKSIRVTIDWRDLNSKTIADSYPMQNPEELLSLAAGAKFLSKFDIRKAFFQVNLEENSRKYFEL